jgi:hypothetical protein
MTPISRILKKILDGKELTPKQREILNKAQNKQCEFSKKHFKEMNKK